MGPSPTEPYWRTNTSFSPPLSTRWDQSFENEELPIGSNSALQLYGSSLSSNSKESRISMRVREHHIRSHSASDGAGSYFSSPTDSFLTQQWTPPMKGSNIDDSASGAMREPAPRPLVFTPSMEGTSALPYSGGSTSSRSDGSESEPIAKSYISSNRNFSNRRCFMSKPIHPISFSNPTTHLPISTGSPSNYQIPNDNNSTHRFDAKSVQDIAENLSFSGFPGVGSSTTQKETHLWSSGSSSMDFTDVSEQLESVSIGPSYDLSEGVRCGLCEKFLSQRSPWSSRRIVRTGDMPVTGVLPCSHVFHADCLEQATPKMQKQDPPCPVCARSEENSSSMVISRSRNGLPRLKPSGEEGPSKPWSCGQVGDCVEGALHASPRNNMLFLNRNRPKKHLSFKGDSGKETPDKLGKSGPFSSQIFYGRSSEQEAVSGSRKVGGPVLKRW